MLAGLAGPLGAPPAQAQAGGDDRPWNVVFILADDLGWNQVGYHGTTYYRTPNIDRIAAEGMAFSDAYAAASICSPSRASIMTGKYPARLHITDYIPGAPYPYARLSTPQMAAALPLEEVTIPEVLKARGYVSGHFGKWHLSPDKDYVLGRPFDPGSQGFDEVLATVKPEDAADPYSDAHHVEEISERSLQFVEAHRDEPFFLYVSHHVVHRPLIETPERIAAYAKRPESILLANEPTMGAMIEHMDDTIGQLLDTLDELSLSDHTVVVFFSDNGGLELLQDQEPLRGGKAMQWEGGIRVPLAIRWPGVVEPGSVSHVPVSSIDFFPTLADIVGAEPSAADVDGVSLVPLLRQTGPLDRDALYWHYPHYHHLGYKPSGAIREGDYKLIEWYEQSLTGEPHAITLYNVRTDIAEAFDLADAMPDRAATMLAQLRQWRQEVGAQEMTVNPNYDLGRQTMRFPEGQEEN